MQVVVVLSMRTPHCLGIFCGVTIAQVANYLKIWFTVVLAPYLYLSLPYLPIIRASWSVSDLLFLTTKKVNKICNPATYIVRVMVVVRKKYLYACMSPVCYYIAR